MNKLKMPSDEVVCDYCHIRYPDERALKFHEVIHIDDDIDTYLKCSGILSDSDHLPKAKQILPNGIRNNRSLEINHRRVVSRYGKLQYSKVLDVSEAIHELLDLCKRYPLRESADLTREELLEYDDTRRAGKVQIDLCSPSNNSELTSVCSSDFEASSLSSPSIESGSDDSESDQIKAQYEEEQDNRVSPAPISNKESFRDRGSTPKELSSKIVVKDSNNPADVTVSQSKIEIIDLMENLVSEVAVVRDDLSKSSSAPEKLNPNMERSTSDKCAIMQQNIKFDLQASDKPSIEAFEQVDENGIIDEIRQFQNVPDFQAVDKPSVSFEKNMMIGDNLQIQNVPDLYTLDKLGFEVRGSDDENVMIVVDHQIENVTDAVYSMPIIC